MSNIWKSLSLFVVVASILIIGLVTYRVQSSLDIPSIEDPRAIPAIRSIQGAYAISFPLAVICGILTVVMVSRASKSRAITGVLSVLVALVILSLQMNMSGFSSSVDELVRTGEKLAPLYEQQPAEQTAETTDEGTTAVTATVELTETEQQLATAVEQLTGATTLMGEGLVDFGDVLESNINTMMGNSVVQHFALFGFYIAASLWFLFARKAGMEVA